jgi:hypothetical protein
MRDARSRHTPHGGRPPIALVWWVHAVGPRAVHDVHLQRRGQLPRVSLLAGVRFHAFGVHVWLRIVRFEDVHRSRGGAPSRCADLVHPERPAVPRARGEPQRGTFTCHIPDSHDPHGAVSGVAFGSFFPPIDAQCAPRGAARMRSTRARCAGREDARTPPDSRADTCVPSRHPCIENRRTRPSPSPIPRAPLTDAPDPSIIHGPIDPSIHRSFRATGWHGRGQQLLHADEL